MDFEERIVEAIEEGKIVRVTEEYARREDLPILRQSVVKQLHNSVSQLSPGNPERVRERGQYRLSAYAKEKEDWKEKQVISELVDNFNWIIRLERRKKGITRRQFAKILNEREEDIRIIEEGKLPVSDFVLLNKIQKALGINLRKDKKDFDVSIKDLMPRKEEKKEESVLGNDVEILEGEI